jgi:hypothetical protein
MQKRKTIRWYHANNLVDLNRNSIADGADIGWNAFVIRRHDHRSLRQQSSILTTVKEGSPFDYPTASSTTTDPTVAYQQTLASAGNTPWSRNESDARVIN